MKAPEGRHGRAVLAALVALAGLLCALGLGRPSLWIDETHSWEFAALPSFGLVALNAAARDAYPPLYFLLLHGWMALGSPEIWLRAFSVLCHLATIPLLYLVGRRLVSAEAGLVAAALLAVNPFHLAYAREVRMYALVGLLSLASVWGMLAWLQDGARRGFRAFLAATPALLYTHFIAVLLPLAQAVAVLDRRWRARDRVAGGRRWLVVTTVIFAPWLAFFLKSLVTAHGYGAEAPAGRLLMNFLGAVGTGFGARPALSALAAATTGLLAVGGLLTLAPGPERRLLALWAFLPPALELAAGAAGKPVFGERTLITCTPAWLLLAAAAVTRLAAVPAACGTAFAGGLAGLGVAHLLAWSLATAPASREAVRDLLPLLRPGDAIVHSATTTYHPVHEYYLPRAGAQVPDFLIEPQGGFAGGRLATWFRDHWRAVRARLDPAGKIHSGNDPGRVGEGEFLGHGYARVWYFHTTLAGARRQWLLVPSVFGAPTPDKVKDTPWAAHPALNRAYRATATELCRPGLEVELYQRR